MGKVQLVLFLQQREVSFISRYPLHIYILSHILSHRMIKLGWGKWENSHTFFLIRMLPIYLNWPLFNTGVEGGEGGGQKTPSGERRFLQSPSDPAAKHTELSRNIFATHQKRLVKYLPGHRCQDQVICIDCLDNSGCYKLANIWRIT